MMLTHCEPENARRGQSDGQRDAEYGRQLRPINAWSELYCEAYERAYLAGKRRLARHAVLFARIGGDEELIQKAEEAYREVVTAPMKGGQV